MVVLLRYIRNSYSVLWNCDIVPHQESYSWAGCVATTNAAIHRGLTSPWMCFMGRYHTMYEKTSWIRHAVTLHCFITPWFVTYDRSQVKCTWHILELTPSHWTRKIHVFNHRTQTDPESDLQSYHSLERYAIVHRSQTQTHELFSLTTTPGGWYPRTVIIQKLFLPVWACA